MTEDRDNWRRFVASADGTCCPSDSRRSSKYIPLVVLRTDCTDTAWRGKKMCRSALIQLSSARAEQDLRHCTLL